MAWAVRLRFSRSSNAVIDHLLERAAVFRYLQFGLFGVVRQAGVFRFHYFVHVISLDFLDFCKFKQHFFYSDVVEIYRRFGIYSASFHRCDGTVAETFVVYPLSYRKVCFAAF